MTLSDGAVELERKPSVDDPLAALAFKVVTDPHVGRLVYLRIYSGVLEAGSTIYNSAFKITRACRSFDGYAC
ncbi:MAG: hypothetical protein CM1200mP39_18330 [Dehalococcoidia bacterium]|nr:MAG: hypothetical protein CM1200mP39_18330 [Dehalococcoidia bacterium]